jgi:hypothetical protein
MLFESFAFDLNKLLQSLDAKPYHEFTIPGNQTESGRAMRVKRKLDIHWNKRECLERAITLQKQALTFRPGNYPNDASKLGTSVESCLERIKTIVNQGFYDAEIDALKPLISNGKFWS